MYILHKIQKAATHRVSTFFKCTIILLLLQYITPVPVSIPLNHYPRHQSSARNITVEKKSLKKCDFNLLFKFFFVSKIIRLQHFPNF